MAIQIKELLPGDSLSGAIDKLNFNFDQLILGGGGPEGPQGIQGIIGPGGAKGDRGSIWYYSGVSGTAGATLPALVFDNDKILDVDGIVWNYDSGVWSDSGIDLTGPTGSAGVGGAGGAGGSIIRYGGTAVAGDWVVAPNGSTGGIQVSNAAPNFFGFFDTNDVGLAQGVDTFIFGHNQDVTGATNGWTAGTIPKMIVLQSNFSSGLSIGLGGNYSRPSAGIVDFNDHAQIFKDSANVLNITGGKSGALPGSSEIKINTSNTLSRIKLLGNESTQISVGHNLSDNSIGRNILLDSNYIVQINSNNNLIKSYYGIHLDPGSAYDKVTGSSGDYERGDFILHHNSAGGGQALFKGFSNLQVSGNESGAASTGISIVPNTDGIENENGYLRLENVNGEYIHYEMNIYGGDGTLQAGQGTSITIKSDYIMLYPLEGVGIGSFDDWGDGSINAKLAVAGGAVIGNSIKEQAPATNGLKVEGQVDLYHKLNVSNNIVGLGSINIAYDGSFGGSVHARGGYFRGDLNVHSPIIKTPQMQSNFRVGSSSYGSYASTAAGLGNCVYYREGSRTYMQGAVWQYANAGGNSNGSATTSNGAVTGGATHILNIQKELAPLTKQRFVCAGEIAYITQGGFTPKIEVLFIVEVNPAGSGTNGGAKVGINGIILDGGYAKNVPAFQVQWISLQMNWSLYY